MKSVTFSAILFALCSSLVFGQTPQRLDRVARRQTVERYHSRSTEAAVNSGNSRPLATFRTHGLGKSDSKSNGFWTKHG